MADLIVANTDVDPDDVADNVFLLADVVDSPPVVDARTSPDPAEVAVDESTPSDDPPADDERRRDPARDQRPDGRPGPGRRDA